MKIYEVGGCVRDKLLGLQPKDYDYVVVGATPKQMLERGFKQVGVSFPVFLDLNGREYALARTERKIGVGYHGFEIRFDPSVTLEEDLLRRDLTINAMAIDIETGTVIDPYNGQSDLAAGILQHTSEAFAEDPVRVLRTARFAARYENFTIAQTTLDLMKRIAPELNYVSQERIWAEFEKGLMENRPDRMIQALKETQALAVEALRPYGGADIVRLQTVVAKDSLPIRFALAGRGFNTDDYEICRIPTNCAAVSKIVNQFFEDFVNYESKLPEQRLALMYKTHVFGNHDVFDQAINVMMHYGDLEHIRKAINALLCDIDRVKTFNPAEIASRYKTGEEIKKAIYKARLNVLLQNLISINN